MSSGSAVLDAVNETKRAFSSNLCMHQIFEKQAEKTPDRTASVCATMKLTYRELNTRANQLAHHLRERGITPESTVSIYMNRSQEMLISVLAVLKAGAAYVPIDPTYPADRIAYVVSNAQSPFVLSTEGMEAGIGAKSMNWIFVDSFFAKAKDLPADFAKNPATLNKPDSLAYVIYTSGSTGNPKGVEISHRALVNFIESMQSEPGISANDVLVAVTTLSFDIAGLELFLPLSVGASVVIAGKDTVADGIKLKELISSCQATIMQATPATWRMLFDAGWEGNKQLKVLCGGEPMPRMLANRLVARCGSLWNMYGPTETTIWSTIYQVSGNNDVVPIGKPIANTDVYVVGEKMERLPAGEVGELCIGGIGLARGYRGLAAMTAEKFIANPFGEGRIYKTGDLARFRPDGNLECLGRIDHQIKIRGYRIELGEIENVLGQAEFVKVVIVAAKEDPTSEKKLIAYVQPHDSAKINPEQLKKMATAKLPGYMIPFMYVPVQNFVLTPNGKIDRKALPEPDWNAVGESDSVEAPSTSTEKQLAAIWTQILGVKSVGRESVFMNIGGNSITLTRLSHRISETFDVQIPLATLHARASLMGMAQAIDERLK